MQKEVSVSHSKLLIETPEESTESIVLFLPGISGKAFSDRFRPIVDLVLAEGLPIARMHAWEDEADVQSKTLAFFENEIQQVLAYLKDAGYAKVILIGKSFGGGLSLAATDPSVTKKILWAPAIGISEEGTYEELKDTKLNEMNHLLDIQLRAKAIQNDSALICIIHGTADSVIPIANSKTITEAAQHGELEIIEGADHSFKTPKEESALLRATKAFLKN
jgi:alpha-beta hydrolase superfamily lysophospholipase